MHDDGRAATGSIGGMTMTSSALGQAGRAAPGRRRWLILGTVGLAQLMVVLDIAIMNIALPSAQRALGFTTVDRQWVVTAYALAFGGLLLFGGRLGDLVGRKITFLAGALGFAAASAVGGAAASFGMLVAARAVQGAFGALLAPAALSILSTTFSDPKERGKAFGVYGAIVGAGGAIGLVLGGILTEYLNWRWCLYVNLFFAGPAAMGAVLLLKDQRARTRPRLDLPGVAFVSASMFCLVYGFSNAANHNWHTPSSYGFLAAGAALLAMFAVRQARAASPLLPPRLVLDRNRGGAYLAVLIVGAGMFGIFLFLTYYMQQTLGYSPVVSGVAFLPMIAMVVLAANLSNVVLLPRFGPKPLVTAGMLLAAGSLVWLTRIGVHSGYLTAVLGPLMSGRPGPRLHDRAVDEHRDVRCGAAGRGCGLGHAQHRPAGRRLDRHLAAEHDLRQRGGALPDQPPEPGHPGPRAPGTSPDRDVADPRLHHRVLGRRGRLRRRRGDLRHAAAPRPAPRLRARGGRAAGRHRPRRLAARHSWRKP